MRGTRNLTAAALLLMAAAGACTIESEETQMTPEEPAGTSRLATFGGGCFWCVEAVFELTDGVESAVSGYAGGEEEDPTYDEVSAGVTGHAEVVQIRYDPAKISYTDLLEIFFKTHDPTTLNRQGADVGTQYRSIVLCHDDEQREVAERVKADLDAAGAYPNRIVTEIVPLDRFYEAEKKHQDFFELNPGQGYCQLVIQPKIEKFKKVFADRLAK